MNDNARLLEILKAKSFRYDPDFGFTLASGKKSDIYVDVKKTVLSPEGMTLTGHAIYEKIKALKLDGIGGLTLGADPIAYAGAMVSTQAGAGIEVFIVRKEAKKHGTQAKIEGNLKAGARVVVIDDVVTTGGSTIVAIERAKEAGFIVELALAVVDREEGGRENVEAHCPFQALFTRTELLAS
jgi:orotate phosphoribosyltransferase